MIFNYLPSILLTIIILLRTSLTAGLSDSIDEFEGARLLVHREIETKSLFRNKDFIVKYSIYNVGLGPARGIVLDDVFPEDFTVTFGSTKASWNYIAPGSNVTHIAILKPTFEGETNLTWAEVTYYESIEAMHADRSRTVFSNHLCILDVFSDDEYTRNFGNLVLDWIMFGLMTMPTLLIPAHLWYRAQALYNDGSTRRKKNR